MIQIKLIYILIFGIMSNNYAVEESENNVQIEKQTKKSVAFHLADKINDLLSNFNQ